MKPFSGTVFLLITGASRGIGKQIAESFAPRLKKGSQILLLARNLEALNEIRDKLSKELIISTASVDLSTINENSLKEIIQNALAENERPEFDQAIIIHNVGSLGDVSQETIDMTNLKVWQDYYELNVFSPAILNSVFIKSLRDYINPTFFVINITSLCAIQPLKSMGYYCSGKAAREMFFKVFAAENPDINVLNYSPGPVKTDMFNYICHEARDVELKKQFNDMKDEDTVLTTEKTVKRLLQILTMQKYTSGDHVDYYDNEE